MNAADAQSAGIGALVVVILGAVATLLKGGWEVVRDIGKNRRENKSGEQAHSIQLTETAQDVLMALNHTLYEDNANLRKDLNVARADLETAKGRIRELETELDEVRTTASALQTTVSGLQSRLARLEGEHGPD